MNEEKRKEVLKKLKEAKSVEEIIAIAKEDGVELSEENAETIYAQIYQRGQLYADDLAMVVGGFLFFFF